ncbi:hypothetical protein [Mesorhizobium sp. LjRoot246]|uniref:hypothetical protein n=1 Tax=Mesorhizobium sp. LjRoot246 TaxID=3342294 RepID=UPI003ECF8E65
MTDTHPPRPLRRAIAAVVLAFAGLMSGTALADDSSPPTQRGLPGVAGDYRIAKPAPEPEPDDAFPSNGTFKIGDTDVRISGSITVDVGAGGIKPSNR